ncbi:hypothetical protein CTA2_4665 [Colletotrichum tanaceti]|uniref:Vps72/YL1 C-terminal domain-containing protein n=1 Tax=Colletotrichum tanaceti TaxID=1306861 RepID=A0A4U6X9I8_9PEZI|nr:hypothetical protein CTA2_4665 [Colletotrichum tanaceti]TKW51944.1 hypothetical protein CTA1_8932 [Colletotrichum tanaceti]
MAANPVEAKPLLRDESSDSGSGSDSENDTPTTTTTTTTTTPTTVEWLATGRSRRSTAGNRMKSMLANEEPDSDLELLFAEDDNDEGFTDVGDAGSDVQMDSSSDDEDEQNRGDDFEGEKELEKQARERKLASRKRKAEEAIPAKFRKKVRIDQAAAVTVTAAAAAAAAASAPRPKKKSERTSWLPSPADMPIRASLRQTTMLSKEQLHQQMKERETKRLRQLAVMEKKAKKLAASKKPPMTQAERLAEAASVEKRNAKSLNRWEEAEKAREEERLAKLAALNNRTLKGPVVTYWSGIGKWENHLKHVGRVAEEEKAPRKKREKKDKGDKTKGKEKDEKEPKKEGGSTAGTASTSVPPPSTSPDGQAEAKPGAPLASPAPADTENPQQNGVPNPPSPTATAPSEATPIVKEEDRPRVMAPPPIPPPPTVSPAPSRPDGQPRLMMAPPSIPPPPALGSSSPMAPPPIPPPLPKTSPPVLAAPVLALPVLAPPLGGIHLVQHTTQPKSNVLAPPNTTQHKSPLSMPAPPPPPSARPPPPPSAPLQPTTQPTQPPAPPKSAPPPMAAPSPPPAPAAPPAPEEPPPSEVARNAFILRNFDEELVRDKTVQTQILFGRRMDRLGKPTPRPVCVITAHPARYRDPETGLPYSSAHAYREIQRLRRGEYKWSSLLGAWVGTCTYAARGVPERFLKGGGKSKEPSKSKGVEVGVEPKEADANTVAEATESQEAPSMDKATTPAQEGAVEQPPTGSEGATVPSPSPSPSAPQTMVQQTQTQQQPQPPVEAQKQDQGAKPDAAEPAEQPGVAPVPTVV